MSKALFLALVGGLITAASPAMAQYPYPPPPPPPPGYGAPAYGAPRTQTFGGPGTLALSSDMNLSFMGCSGCASPITSALGPGNNATNSSGWLLTLAPAADYFVIQGLSIGGQVAYSHLHESVPGGTGTTTSTSVDANLFGIFARVGYNIPIGDLLSWWPKVGIGYVDAWKSSGSVGSSANAFDLQIYAPLLLHLAPHFFAGLGPFVQTDLTASSSSGGVSATNYPKQTSYGLMFTIGGWTVPAG
ncbi:MAG TPA: hypothetical protein VGL81_16220 [Polyangiaceae bacterium]